MFLFIFLFLLFQPRLHFGSIDFISFFNLLDPDLGDLPLFEYVRIRNTGFISQPFFEEWNVVIYLPDTGYLVPLRKRMEFSASSLL